MKFKVDENLPVEIAEILRAADHDVLMVFDQGLQGGSDSRIASVCKQEERVIVTLDLDFADIRAYPPEQFSGIIVLRVARQDKNHVIAVFKQIISALEIEPLVHHLWVVEENQIRIRGEN